jgi:hypothetical protein
MEQRERLEELCAKIQIEKDPAKFTELVTQFLKVVDCNLKHPPQRETQFNDYT